MNVPFGVVRPAKKGGTQLRGIRTLLCAELNSNAFGLDATYPLAAT
ncbi:MAG: hypothetical protein ABIU29_00995 [Chthoniobacterales bacterium]